MALSVALPLEKARPHLASAIRLVLLLAVSKGLALAASIVIARQFDRQVSGLLFFVTGLVTLSLSFTTLGLTASASYHYARNLARRRLARNHQALLLALVVALPSSAAFGLLALAMPEARETATTGLILAVTLTCFFAAIRQWAKTALAIEGQREWSLVHDGILFQAVLLPGLLLLPEKSAAAALVVLTLAAVIAGLPALWHAASYPHGPWILPPRRYAKRLLAIGLPAMAAQGSALLLNRLDVVMLGPLSTAGAVADYAVAMRLTYMAGLPGEIVTILLMPHLAAAAASREPARQWRLLKLTMVSQVFATGLVALPLMLFAGDVVTLVFGAAYLSAVPVFLLLQAGKLLTSAFSPALALFTGLGYSAALARTNLAAAVINLLLNAALIPAWGAQGAAVATFFSLCLMAFRYAAIARDLRRRGGAHAS